MLILSILSTSCVVSEPAADKPVQHQSLTVSISLVERGQPAARCLPGALQVVLEGAGADVSSCRPSLVARLPSGTQMAAIPVKEDMQGVKRRCSSLAMMDLVR